MILSNAAQFPVTRLHKNRVIIIFSHYATSLRIIENHYSVLPFFQHQEFSSTIEEHIKEKFIDVGQLPVIIIS